MNGKRLALAAAAMVVLVGAFALLSVAFAVAPASAAALRPVSTAVPAVTTTSAIALDAAMAPSAPVGFQNSTAFGAGAVITFLAAFVTLMLKAGTAAGRKE